MSKYDDYFSIDDLEDEYQKLEVEYLKSDNPEKKRVILGNLRLIEDAIDDRNSNEDF